jgi:hypothetical protein
MVSAIVRTITTRLLPAPVMRKMLTAATTHTCHGMEWDLDGPSPSEYCQVCQRAIAGHSCSTNHTAASASAGTSAYTGAGIDWETEWARRSVEATLIRTNNVTELMDHDMYVGIQRPWWFYADMIDIGRQSEAEAEAEREKYKRECEETQAREEAMKRDQRAYVSAQDPRDSGVREREFASWLATPKNKRTIVMADGRTMAGVAKADTGSVVLRNCPPQVLLSDIRTIMARFGGVRDVYRPTDRATGAPKPFVFVEMLRNADAWAAVDYFAEVPCVLDGRTLAVSGAGERKTSAEMAAVVGFVSATTQAQPEPAAAKQQAPKIRTGAFAALADSDSE